MATKTSSRYDHITCKELIQSGSPNVYQLKPKKENIGTLTRMTLGEKDPNKRNKTILLVGETGTGKSTLINALVNYAMGVKWEDDVWFQIVENEKKSQCESQTTDVIVYEIFGFENNTLPYSLTIIDTPGYGDTRGIEHDIIVRERLLDLFRSDDGVHEIDAVGLVMKASDNRLSDRLRYIFDSVMSLFGENIEKNIVTLITHSNGRTPKNVLKAIETAEIRCAKGEKNRPVHFLFDNCQDEDRTEETEALQQADKITMKGLSQFTNFLEKTESQKLKETEEVLNEQMRLAACIHNLQDRIKFIELKQSEIKQTQGTLKKYEEEIKNNENFTVEVNEAYKVKEPIEGGRWFVFLNGATCCPVCKETCHHPCTLARSAESCEVMKEKCTLCKDKCFVPDHEKGKPCTECEGKCCLSFHVKGKQCPVCEGKKKESEHVKEMYCTVCTGKCPASVHVKGKQITVCKGEKKESDHVKKMWKYVSKISNIQMTKQDIKEKYEKSRASCKESTSLLETLQKMMDKLEKEKDQCLEESFQHVVTLEQMALKFDSLSTYVHLDFLIEKMKEKGDTEKVQKLEEMKGRMDKNEGIKTALNGFGRITADEAAMRKSSSRYDHITCKDLIQPGSPNVYQLKPKKENIETLTRMTLGEKDPNKRNKTILLVGETGTGKSTLINALVNYAMGVKWEDDVWFQIVEDEKKSQSESQTADVIVYEIFGFENNTLPYSLTIIDTPGYGDTRGSEHNVIVSERLLDLFRSDDGVHEIDAVGLVMKASENRLSDRLRYVYDSVVSLFGKEMKKNVVALITHSNGVTPENVFKALEAANIECAKDEENEPVHFMFDNCQSTQKTKKNKIALKNAWSLTEDQMGQFTDFLTNTSSQNLTTTVIVLNRRTRLTACIHNLQERIEFIELKQREIQQTQEALKKYEQEMKNNEKFMQEKYEKGRAGHEKSTSLLETLQKNIEDLEKEKDQRLEESFQHVVTLEQMALEVDSLSTFVHLDFLIEKMKEKGDTEKVKKLEEMKRQMDKNQGIKAAWSYWFGGVTAAGKAAAKGIKAAVK